MAVQAEERRHWPLVVAIAVTLIIVIAAFATFRTMPPRTISMATGPEGGAYYEIGKRYQALLARSGVRVRLVPTSGSVDNLAMLRNRQSGVGVALLQGGTVPEGGAPEIESLGTVFYEPLWLFNRKEFHYAGLEALRGRKVSIGTEGSGTRALSLELLKRRGYDGETMQLLGYSTQEAADKLLAGEIDALVMLASWESPVVRKSARGRTRGTCAIPQHRRLRRALSVSEQGDRAGRSRRLGEQPAAVQCSVVRAHGESRGAQRPAFRDPIPAA